MIGRWMGEWMISRQKGGWGRHHHNICCCSLPGKLQGFKSKTRVQMASWRRQPVRWSQKAVHRLAWWTEQKCLAPRSCWCSWSLYCLFLLCSHHLYKANFLICTSYPRTPISCPNLFCIHIKMYLSMLVFSLEWNANCISYIMQIPQIHTNQTEASSVCDHRQLYKTRSQGWVPKNPARTLGLLLGLLPPSLPLWNAPRPRPVQGCFLPFINAQPWVSGSVLRSLAPHPL